MSAEGQVPAEDDKAVVRRFWDEVSNRANRAVAYEILAPDYHLRDPDATETGEISEPDGLLGFLGIFRGRYHNLHASINWQLEAEGNHVVTQYTLGGTIVGTSKRVQVEGLSISLLSEGRIARSWASWDAERLLRQDPGPNAVPSEELAPGLAPDPGPVEVEPLQAEKSKILVKRFWKKVSNEDKHPVAWDVLDNSYRLYGPAAMGSSGVNGPGGVVGLVKRLREEHKGSSSTVKRQLAVEGDRILTYYTIQRKDRTRDVQGMSVSRFVGEKIRESWANWDAMAIRVDHGPHEKHILPWW